jgi:8-amino-7-oxononanoate synthase
MKLLSNPSIHKSTALLQRLQQQLAERARNGLHRTLSINEEMHDTLYVSSNDRTDQTSSSSATRDRTNQTSSSSAARDRTNQTRLINFASNDYLGLRADPAIKQAFADAAQQYGLGAGASHLLGGHHQEHARLESQLAEWTGRESVVLFGSGFQAALGVLAALTNKDDVVIADKLSHACLIDGAKLSNASLRRFAHQDLDHAKSLLEQSQAQAVLLVTESIFSMDGDASDLPALAKLAQQHKATLMVDDAHGIGVIGARGEGAAAKLAQDDCPILMLTFGKALGSAGAAICGSRDLIDGLINFARPLIYTTAMPVAIAAATSTAVQMAQAQSWRREKLRARIGQFREGAQRLGIRVGNSQHAIQPIFLPDIDVQVAAKQLASAGFYLPAIRPPTVPPGTARLRLSLSALHTPEMVAALLEALAALLG